MSIPFANGRRRLCSQELLGTKSVFLLRDLVVIHNMNRAPRSAVLLAQRRSGCEVSVRNALVHAGPQDRFNDSSGLRAVCREIFGSLLFLLRRFAQKTRPTASQIFEFVPPPVGLVV
jgi:hypothetical protein